MCASCSIPYGTATSAFFSPAGQGRLFYWNPGFVDGKKALPSSHPELLARFAKEASVTKTELFPDIDTLDVVARQEGAGAGGHGARS